MCRILIWGLVLLVPLPAVRADDDKKADDKKADDKGMVIKGKLDPADPKDKVKTNSPHKVHEQRMKSGENYQIDLVSGAFDPFLRLEDSAGKQLAEDDDGGGFPNARILFKAPKDGTYRIVATSFDGKSGDYTLTIKKASGASVAATSAFNAAMAEFQKGYNPAVQMLMKKYREAKTDAEREKLLDKFSESAEKYVERFAKVAKDFPGQSSATQAAAVAQQLRFMIGNVKTQIVVSVGNMLRDEYEKAYQAKAKNADELYKKAETFFTEGAKKYASNAMIANQLKDGAYLLEKLSIGKLAPEIEGEDLDGKKFKLSDYRGKVVVLDFWGNW
jgi:hypothetical protein